MFKSDVLLTDMSDESIVAFESQKMARVSLEFSVRPGISVSRNSHGTLSSILALLCMQFNIRSSFGGFLLCRSLCLFTGQAQSPRVRLMFLACSFAAFDDLCFAEYSRWLTSTVGGLI